MKPGTFKKLLLLGYFLCACCAWALLPRVLEATGFFIPWERTEFPFCHFIYNFTGWDCWHPTGLGAWIVFGGPRILACFYAVLTLVSLTDLCSPNHFVRFSSDFRISVQSQQIVHYAALIIPLPAMLATIFLLGMSLFWNSYNESEAYWNLYSKVIAIESRIFGTSTAQRWCVHPAEEAWRQGHYSAARRFCKLALSYQDKSEFSKQSLPNLYWKTGCYADAIDKTGAEPPLGKLWTPAGMQTIRVLYLGQPHVEEDLRAAPTMKAIPIEAYELRDCLDRCCDRLGTSEAQKQFPQFKRGRQLSKRRDVCIEHSSLFWVNALFLVDEDTFRKLQVYGKGCKSLTLSSNLLNRMWWGPLHHIGNLQRNS